MSSAENPTPPESRSKEVQETYKHPKIPTLEETFNQIKRIALFRYGILNGVDATTPNVTSDYVTSLVDISYWFMKPLQSKLENNAQSISAEYPMKTAMLESRESPAGPGGSTYQEVLKMKDQENPISLNEKASRVITALAQVYSDLSDIKLPQYKKGDVLIESDTTCLHSVFCGERIPGKKIDTIENSISSETPKDKFPTHIVVIANGIFYPVNITRYDSETHKLVARSQEGILAEIQQISKDSKDPKRVDVNSQVGLGLFAGQKRPDWKKDRDKLLETPENKKSLEILESAVAHIHLIDTPKDLSTSELLTLKNNPEFRESFDSNKTLNLAIVGNNENGSKNSEVLAILEHAACNGAAINNISREIVQREGELTPLDEDALKEIEKNSSLDNSRIAPSPLTIELPDELSEKKTALRIKYEEDNLKGKEKELIDIVDLGPNFSNLDMTSLVVAAMGPKKMLSAVMPVSFSTTEGGAFGTEPIVTEELFNYSNLLINLTEAINQKATGKEGVVLSKNNIEEYMKTLSESEILSLNKVLNNCQQKAKRVYDSQVKKYKEDSQFDMVNHLAALVAQDIPLLNSIIPNRTSLSTTLFSFLSKHVKPIINSSIMISNGGGGKDSEKSKQYLSAFMTSSADSQNNLCLGMTESGTITIRATGEYNNQEEIDAFKSKIEIYSTVLNSITTRAQEIQDKKTK